MLQNEDGSPAASSFRRYSFFGFVDVGVYPVKNSPSVVSSISIIDNLSLKQVQLEILEAAAIDYVGFTGQCIFFLVSQTGKVFAYKDQVLFCVQHVSSGQAWQWVKLDVHIQESKLQVPDGSSNLPQQWSHWNDWMSEQIPSAYSKHSSRYFLVCTFSSAFLIVNSEEDTKGSTFEKIYDSRTSKNTMQKMVLDFSVKEACGGNDHIVLLDVSGEVHTCGTGSHGELGHGVLDSEQKPKNVEMFSEAEVSIVQIAAGGWHSCALTSEGDLYGWGWNNHGQLGYSPEEFSIKATPHPFDIDQNILAVGCRNNTTFLKLENGKQLTFGEFQEI